MPKPKEVNKSDAVKAAFISGDRLSVTVEKSYTTKLGDDYAKISISATMPWNPTKEEIELARETIIKTSELVESELLNELDIITGKKEGR